MIRCPACGGNNAKQGHCALCGCYLSPLLEESDVERCVSGQRPSLAEECAAIINEGFPTFQDVQRFSMCQRLLAIEMEDDMQATNGLLNLNRRRP